MKSHHELLILQNAMDCKVDIYITNFNIKNVFDFDLIFDFVNIYYYKKLMNKYV